MAKTLSGKSFTWHHISDLSESDFGYLEKHFKFHPLDFDDLRDDTALPKLDVYKYYLFAVLAVPQYDTARRRISKRDLAVFIGSDYIVTVCREPIDAVDRFFSRAKRSSGLRRDALGKSTGYFLYKLLDYVFRDAKIILHELSREAQQVEVDVYERQSRGTSESLGVMKRNLLFLQHIIDPQRLLVHQFMTSRKKFLPSELDVYFDDVKDTLDSIWVITENLKNIVDSLFDVNEAILTHRTNQIIRWLTIISVVLMPPTLIASYYGMNVSGLPFADNIGFVSWIIGASVIGFVFFVLWIDRRR